MKAALLVLLLAGFLAGCLESVTTLPVAAEVAVGNPAQTADVCTPIGASFIITNQELASNGWRVELSNISGGTSSNLYLQAESVPKVVGETVSVSSDSVGPAVRVSIQTSGAYDAGKRYRTDFNLNYYDSVTDFNRLILFTCSGYP